MSNAKNASRGRPPVETVGTRDERVMIRATAEERAAWQAEADADGRPLSQWIRRAIMRAMTERARKRLAANE